MIYNKGEMQTLWLSDTGLYIYIYKQSPFVKFYSDTNEVVDWHNFTFGQTLYCHIEWLSWRRIALVRPASELC